ncbi:ATP-binding protein [Sphaerisporangium rufum]|nr:ATP-binding protein [Sphaerisporangium rufum]
MPFEDLDEEPGTAADPITLLDGPPFRSKPDGEPGHPGPDILVWRRTFPNRPDQAPEARRFARLLLAGTRFADDAELIVGELAGNAVRHTGGGPPGGHFTVEITVTTTCRPATAPAADGVLITVSDPGGGGVPRFDAGRPDTHQEHGRGLGIVTALATRAGAQGTPVGGHRVWAYLTGPASRWRRAGSSTPDHSREVRPAREDAP